MSAAAGVVWTGGRGGAGDRRSAAAGAADRRRRPHPAGAGGARGRDRRRHRRPAAAADPRPHHGLTSGVASARRGRLSTRRDSTTSAPSRSQARRRRPGEPLDPGRAPSPSAGLVKRYGDFVAVDGLDLDIRRGEIFALLGPNGAGKTTTVEICEGYRDRDAGEVRVLGEDPADGDRRVEGAAGHRAAVRLRRQPADRAARLLHGPGRPTTPTRATPTRCSSWSGSPRRPASRGKSLSGGQRRRLDVALGIVGRPTLLFLDEPTTGFDPEARRQFWSLIRSLRELGTTMLLTTHYLDEAEALADRVGRDRPRPAGGGRRPVGARRPGDRARGGQLDRGRRPAQRGDARRPRRSCGSWPPGSPARCPTWPSPGRPSRTSTCG